MSNKYDLLKEYFGHKNFRVGQEEIIDNILSGRDAMCVMPTGAGKSICYQIPALLFDGITIVISPLISLMKDQVAALNASGISAAYVNSSLSLKQYEKVLDLILEGKYKIIYVAPERLVVNEFVEICKHINISMVAIDEAHCVSQWGQDFRPGYLKIPDFINLMDKRPVVCAFTATATAQVKSDILNLLKLKNPLSITTGFDRPNLFFSTVKPKNKYSELYKIIKERKEQFGIVYCSTRKAVEEVCHNLEINDFSVTRYHAGLSEEERKQNQEDFVYDRKKIMVATNAFGMGIDKSNISFVIHYNMPKNIESYYQEAGRAGRDGSNADCILLYSPKDVHTNQYLIEKTEPNPDLDLNTQQEIKQKDFEGLKQITFYSTTTNCLRAFILNYFGEKTNLYCGKCSNCLTNFEEIDITIEAQMIMSCIAKTNQNYGKKMIVDILRGSKNERILSSGLQKLSTYNLMGDRREKEVLDIINSLINQGFIMTMESQYPVLKLTDISKDVLFDGKNVYMKIVKSQKTVKNSDVDNKNTDLLNTLKTLRMKFAKAEKVPAYIIFSDKTLLEMCKRLPDTPESFLEISGVGNAKLIRYGAEFIDTIKKSKKGDFKC